MTNDLITRLASIHSQAMAELNAVQDLDGLERWRLAYLGRNAPVAEVLKSLGTLAAEERRPTGQRANEVKQALEAALESRRETLRASEWQTALDRDRLDVTLPGRPMVLGGYHPTTLILRQIAEIFTGMGYQIVEGPEVERDYYNFEALNIPPDHPARDMWDTFYISPPDVLLRTHTSPMQVRTMEQAGGAPVRVIVPGRCYRYEAQDASHEWMFYQVEGLAVGENLTMADLKGTLGAFVRQLFRRDLQIRFRCDYFPFVEPGVDMSISCHVCGGSGCRVCKGGGWIEIMGAGMVHPRVLEMAGYDPERYSGFAFGMGPERIAMIKYGISDIRLFYGNDLRFLQQFN
ncbi:MAG: phenylalanine--tRNA ligase subunit alpha [Chloroflexota bacterium]